MRTLRPWLSAVLGLMFLVQGMAVAAAPHVDIAEASVAVTEAEPPCHGVAEASVDTPAGPACCGADCAQMASCLLGHLAAGVMPTLELPPAGRIDAIARIAALHGTAPPFLLRPPIASNA